VCRSGCSGSCRGGLLDVADERQVRAAGATLGWLHQALTHYPGNGYPQPEPLPLPLPQRITAWLESDAGKCGLTGTETLRERLRGLGSSAAGLPVQLVHNDFRSANVLWHATGISAVLDFEEAAFDHCVADLANAALLLGTRYHNWAAVEPAVQDALVAGYQTERPLSEQEEVWLRALILWRTLCAVPAGAADADPGGWASAAEQLAASLP